VQGFEPQSADPESAVLPLNDTPMYGEHHIILSLADCQAVFAHGVSVTFLQRNTPTRATVKVPTPHLPNPRPYYDDGEELGAFIVRAGVAEWRGGDPCGRPGRSAVAFVSFSAKKK
jgi:hypothetical protein